MTDPRRYHLALEEFHTNAGATFSPRGNWWLPAHYGDASAEYRALRETAIAADRSDRSRFIVSGTDALPVLNAVFTGHIDDIEEGRAMRAARLTGDGTLADLVLVSRTGGIAYVVTGEPGSRDATRAALQSAIQPDFDARVDDRTETTCGIAVAGRQAADAVVAHLSEALPSRLPALHVTAFEFHGFRGTAVRTSDTGEDGFELMLAPAVALHLLETLTQAGIPLAGTEALESARVEACIPAMYPDLANGLSPGEAGLDTIFGLDDPGAARRLVPLLLETTAVVPSGTTVTRDGKPVGQTGSCVRAYSLDAIAALAVIDHEHANPGTTLDVNGSSATVVTGPLYRRR